MESSVGGDSTAGVVVGGSAAGATVGGLFLLMNWYCLVNSCTTSSTFGGLEVTKQRNFLGNFGYTLPTIGT